MNGLPDNVRRFIAANISSVADLEVLLLLRDHAQKGWTAAEIAKELYTHPVMAATQLAGLHAHGLLTVTDGSGQHYQYAPKAPELDQVVASLAELYKDRRVSVITLIYAEPVDKVRSFADSFRLRKEE